MHVFVSSLTGKVRENAVLEVVEAWIEIFHLMEHLFKSLLLGQFGESSENFSGVLQEVKDFFLAGREKNAVSLIVGQAFFLVIFLENVQVFLVGGIVFRK